MKSLIVGSALALIVAVGSVVPASALVVGVGPRGVRVGVGHPYRGYRGGYGYRGGFARRGVVRPLVRRRGPVVIVR